ncbi:MAG: alanine racemase [Acholeplasmatales bacterium]|nr:alanine racemase [Acholeplasmatales bacterium]
MLFIDYYEIEKELLNIKKTNDIVLVLKNDAYGFGIDKMLKIANKLGINEFVVNDIYEGILINRKGNKVILLAPLNKSFDYKNLNIYPTAQSIEDIIYLEDNNIDYYLKIKTTMNRFGTQYNNQLLTNKHLKGIYMHLPKINNEDLYSHKYIQKQAFIKGLDFHVGGSILIDHTISKIRLAGSLYKNARSFYGHVLDIKLIHKGERIGYESLYEAPCDHLYAILDVGYYNGINRYFSGRVYANNNFYDVIGLVCMNHTFIRVDSSVIRGQLVEFFGKNIKIDEFLAKNNMTLYESYFAIK